VRLVVAGLTCAGALGVGVASSSATAQHAPAAALGVQEIGPSPTGISPGCPFGNGDFGVQFLAGNAVFHESSNKNGDWGGNTIEGPAQFGLVVHQADGSLTLTPMYQGHLTIWAGGGNNKAGQSEGGETFNFNGLGVSDPTAMLGVHFNTHSTTNNAGTPTANVLNVSITCS
jgi:hypothetical protein